MAEGFFQDKFPDNFSAGDLECSCDQIVEKILPEVWEILSLSQTVYLIVYMFLTYDITDHGNFLPISYSGHGKSKVDKTARKKFAKSPKLALLKFTKILQKRFEEKLFIL